VTCSTARPEHAPRNAMEQTGEVEAFYDRCSPLMRELLDELATAPDHPRPFPETLWMDADQAGAVRAARTAVRRPEDAAATRS